MGDKLLYLKNHSVTKPSNLSPLFYWAEFEEATFETKNACVALFKSGKLKRTEISNDFYY